MGRGRPKKTPSDDSLTLPVGAEAELRSNDPGFVGSFYEITVTGHLVSSASYTVAYATLVADDGGPLEETAAAADVRPRPPPSSARTGFAVHDAVEAFHDEGWWAGVVSAVPGPGPRVYEVTFPTSRETMEFQETALRPHRVFQAGQWVTAAEADDGSALFREGTQVEVRRSGKSFGESWSPASVLKVIGTTKFLVQYMHIGSDGELATEIIAAQYTRPAQTFRKYRFSQSFHVEVMHEHSWWPGVLLNVLGSGINKKYVVKLKSYETDMEDVECLDVLTVEKTHISANVPTLACRKRPISCALSLQKGVGETTDKHGSCREKKLKNTDVVSEPISPHSPVCNESNEIKCQSSSFREGKKKQGNAVPASLPPMAGFSQLSVPSLAQSSHLEQAHSPNIIIPSAPVAAPQRRQLQASMFETLGQPRPLPQGPPLGMRTLAPQSEVIAAKSIEEARNTVSLSEVLAKPKNGDDNVELHYNVAAGCGMLSETDTVNSVGPMTTPKDIGGPQHAVSQQGHGPAMDSESFAIQHLPFRKTSPVWARIEAMEIFSEMPQRPNLNEFQKHGPEVHEGMTLGLMLSFATLAESICRLDVHQDDIGRVFEEKKQGLSLLEENGFDVRVLRSRLEALLCT
ncbi:hypothetical protein ACQ4PT_027170 [Festuca glaucescens]